MITIHPVIDFSAAELADSMLVDRPDGLTVPVNDARQGDCTQILAAPSMSIEKRTAKPTDPSSRLIGQAHTPFDRSHSAKLTPRFTSAAPCLHGMTDRRLKKGLLRVDFLAFERFSSLSFNVVGRENFNCSGASRAHAAARQLDGTF